ncbi:MAG: hypothetical protein FD153_642 [Rhodospirillaceae bacterium]|nr:MAG: hypothetical protein FD153_642 [Rhodospirillaceae bacterium]
MRSLSHLESTIATGDMELLRMKTTACTRAVQKLMDVASAITHGPSTTMQQGQIGDLLGF